MPEQTASLQQRVGRLLAHLDAMDVDSLMTMVTDDVQTVDEISRRWSRGRAAVASYLSQLKGSVSDIHSRMSDAHEAVWGEVGLVTFALDQTYTMDGQQQAVSAPTSILFRREQADWKIALIHSVPIGEAP